MKKSSFASLVVVGGLAFATLSATPALAATGPCPNGLLCAWDQTGFAGTRFGNQNGSVVDVPDDVTRSTHNYTSSAYRAMKTAGLTDSQVAYFSAGYLLSSYGAANNTVDHFRKVV